MKCVVTALLLLIPASLVQAQDTSPVPAKNGVVVLGPANSTIGFIGTHQGAEPKPRKGGFQKFSGKASLGEGGELEAVTLDIQTSSLWTEISKLTNHLKSPDFFSVREHPQATFRSTAIAAAKESGAYTMKGDFTLLGVTKEISIPATVGVNGKGLTLVSNFTIDRTQFGMTYGQDNVKKEVSISVVIGKATEGR